MASSTICSARWLDCWLSSCWAAAPVMPSASPVPAISGLMSARSTLTASRAVVPEPLTTLLGMATSAVCTRPFGDRGPAVMLTILRMCLPSSVAATAVIFAASAAVGRPPSERADTMIAAELVTWPVCGNAWSCRFAARIDSSLLGRKLLSLEVVGSFGAVAITATAMMTHSAITRHG